MKIYLHGTQTQISELYKALQCNTASITIHDSNSANLPLNEYDVLIDAALDKNPKNLHNYIGLSDTLLLAGCNLLSLTEMVASLKCPLQCTLIGFNNWNTFINRSVWEITNYDVQQKEKVTQIFDQLGIKYKCVADRVGLVTPRVVAMIINEAYFTLQEGTANKHSIDAAMKLGTNYPFGPFEWAERIGLYNVYSLLEAVYNDTHDERYKTCSLLKAEALKNLFLEKQMLKSN